MSETKKESLKIGPVSNEFARKVLGEQKYKDGGGWCVIDDVDVYLCWGVHKNVSIEWRIEQIGRSF